ncbi:SchA/CurD-like domain-containing protein, partial [Kitasatospora sp. NPDC018614]
HGNRVVRAIEVRGDLLAALRHVARQPGIRAVEEAINPYLEQDRDLNDQESARVFFTRAALPAVHHVTSGQDDDRVERHALFYPARPGQGMKLAELLAHEDERAADDPASPVRRSTVFERDDVVVRLIDVVGALEADPAAALGIADSARVAELTTLLDEGAAKKDGDLSRLLTLARMDLVTDRRSAPDA